jgi:hypothetical protein
MTGFNVIFSLAGFYEHGNEIAGSIKKGGEILHWLSDY